MATKFKWSLCVLLLWCLGASAQNGHQDPPKGFDTYQSGIRHGQLDTIHYPSKTVGTDRRALVYLPPGYDQSKKYPVLYLLHGIGGDELEWLNGGHPEIILDNLYHQGKVQPMIVVLPNGRAKKDDRATGDIMAPDKIKAFATFEKDLLSDLIPFVSAHYPVLPDAAHRAIAGLSMGGGQSLNFGLSHLDTFSWVGAFSAAPNTKMPGKLLPDPAAEKAKLKLLWLSCGKSDGLLKISARTHQYLLTHHVPHVYYLMEGVHDFHVWKTSLYLFAQLLFKPVTPKVVARYPGLRGE